jgi:hypothetical protein
MGGSGSNRARVPQINIQPLIYLHRLASGGFLPHLGKMALAQDLEKIVLHYAEFGR